MWCLLLDLKNLELWIICFYLKDEINLIPKDDHLLSRELVLFDNLLYTRHFMEW